MILEVAILNIVSGKQEEFETAFSKAQHIIASIQGYISHQLQKCIEVDNRYLYPSRIGFPANCTSYLLHGGVAIPRNRPTITHHRALP